MNNKLDYNFQKEVGVKMNSDNNEIHAEELQKKMQQKLDTLEQKYSQISTEMKKLQDDKSDLKNSIKTMNDRFEHVNKNVEDILAKLDNISENNRGLDDDAEGEKTDFLARKAIFSPLRKLTVGAVGSVLAVIDKTAELACGAKEGFEDIVAEAQYQRKRKRKVSMDEA
ncbi:hypothetical protein [Clostridium luticellarii]|uniref:hypothetical protein n=1 Tax=Clostridium luticellarii TaxID=1691940 RepID=UPI0023528D15|nr:hypothetical protein [Clostridium luticellarii]MCI1944805.1 hypothetical protein [Clostridium luticellarii]MCI1968300.1 hypothetical protein [Clostridium luticellarii]